LLDGVADRADLSIAASGVRHTNALVTARINRSIQKWKRMVAEAGDDTWLVTTRTVTSTSTTRDAANWAPYQYIAQPTGCMLMRGIDVWSGQTPIGMLPLDELERNDATNFSNWWGNGGTQRGMPVFYRRGGTNAAGSPLIQIFPYADAVYTVDVRHIPVHTDLSATSDLSTAIEFTCGGEDWVELDAALESLRTDGLVETGAYQDMRVDRDRAKADMQFTLACRGTLRKMDTKERRRELMELAHGPWRLP
jgi:hypothetical protein